MSGLTNSVLAQQVQALLDTQKLQADYLTAWLGGSADGGPNLDGRYPFVDLSGREILVPSPATFNDMVSGPAALADVAKVAAELARDLAQGHADRADAQRALSEAARGAAIDARNLAQEHRSHAGTHEANARYWAELAQGSGQGSADDRAVVEQLAAETADNAASASQDASDAAASAALAATFDPALYDLKSDGLNSARLFGMIDPARIPVLLSQYPVMSAGGLADLTTAQQQGIGPGTIVATTDGKRWAYKGDGGSKTAASGYIEQGDVTPIWDAIADKPLNFPSTIALVPGLQAALDGKAVAGHGHSIGNITGLQAALDSKQPALGFTPLNTVHLSAGVRHLANYDHAPDAEGVNFSYGPNSALNKPEGLDHAVQTLAYNGSWATQMASDWRTNDWWVRTRNSGSWGGWQKLFHTGNLPAAAYANDPDTLMRRNANGYTRLSWLNVDGGIYHDAGHHWSMEGGGWAAISDQNTLSRITLKGKNGSVLGALWGDTTAMGIVHPNTDWALSMKPGNHLRTANGEVYINDVGLMKNGAGQTGTLSQLDVGRLRLSQNQTEGMLNIEGSANVGLGGSGVMGDAFTGDGLAFHTPYKVEKTSDFSSWTDQSADHWRELFSGRLAQRFGSANIALWPGERAVRIYSHLGYKFIEGLALSGSTNGNYVRVIVETSTDGSGWVELFRTNWHSSWPGYLWHRWQGTNGGGRDFWRFTIERTLENSYSVSIGTMSMPTSYGGLNRLFDWDHARNLYVPDGSQVYVGANKVWHQGDFAPDTAVTANTVVRRRSDGYTNASWINLSAGLYNDSGYYFYPASNGWALRGGNGATSVSLFLQQHSGAQMGRLHAEGGLIGFLDTGGSWIGRFNQNGLYAEATHTNVVTVNSGIGNGVRFWGGDHRYSITMADVGASTYGGRGWNEGSSDYNLVFMMGGGAPRGFVFKNNDWSSAPMASINQGHIHLQGGVQAAGASNFNGQVNFNGGLVYNSNWWRSTGQTGWFNDTYAVGIYTVGNGTVRTYNGAHFLSEGSITASTANIYQNGGSNRVPVTTYSQSAPSGGQDGDVHIVW